MVQHLSPRLAAAPARSAGSLRHRRAFFALAVLNAGAAAWVVWDETWTRRPWKAHQARYHATGGKAGRAGSPGILQVTNPELGLVDRCTTCHLGIDDASPEARRRPQPHRSHPRREILLGRNHPIARFGCTPCHQGQGPQTKGIAGAPFDHGRRDPSWERPLASAPFVQSSCLSCHAEQDELAQAELLNRGRRLFEDRRCFGCHETPHLAPSYPAAPSLAGLRDKTSRAVVEAWLAEPGALRREPRMPRFWPRPLDPASGTPVPSGSRAERRWLAERRAEVTAIAAFLGTLPRATALPPAPPVSESSVTGGRKLFDQIGCRGCHALGDEPAVAEETRFGPRLDREGELASARWLSAWLAGPRKVWAKARMPDFRLSLEERAKLVAFLTSLRRAGEPSAGAGWPPASRAEVERGEATVRRYGCHGCHEIPGLERARRTGPDLDGFGDKTSDLLEWGDARAAVWRHSPPSPPDRDRPLLERWTLEKLLHPRRTETPRLRLVMPDAGLSDQDALALAVFLVGHRRPAPEGYWRRLSAEERAERDGERLFRGRNCRGCHEIGGEARRMVTADGELGIEHRPRGGTHLRRHYADPSHAPPPLTLAGKKFRYQWLSEFLDAPSRIRPWLVARMPTFFFTEAEIGTAVAGFAARDRAPFPFVREPRTPLDPAARADARWLFSRLQCLKCHQLSTAHRLKPGELAPDLALSARRLRAGWLRDWLLAPQTLQPGTRMPTYFPLADDDDPASIVTPYPARLGGQVRRQVEALVELTIELGAGVDASVVGDPGRQTKLTRGRRP